MKRALLFCVILGILLLSPFPQTSGGSQPAGVELVPDGLSRILWMFETPQEEWKNTKSMGEVGHEGDDYYADDWARKDGKTREQIAYAGISGRAIVLPFDADGYGNHVVIYDESSKFALRYAHLDEVLVSDGKDVVAGSTPMGKVGATGLSTGPHLHIVLYKNVSDPKSRPITIAHVPIGVPIDPPTEFAAPFLYNPRGEIPKPEAEIKIEDADAVWGAGLTPSEGLSVASVSPRILAEYADSSFSRELIEPRELTETAKPALPRIIVEHPDSSFSQTLQKPEIGGIPKTVPPRVIVEYADSSFSQTLQSPEGLEGIPKTAPPRIIVEYVDSALLLNLEPFSMVSVERTLSITSVEASPGGHTIVQLNITDTTGVSAGDILVKYDANVITVGDVKGADLISGISLVVKKDVPGEIKLGLAGKQGIPSGSGALVEIELTVSKDAKAGTETTLEFGDTEIYNESGAVIPINLESGTVKIVQIGIKGDVNNDGKIRSNDAMLALRIAAGLMEPSDYQKWAADMNDDGKIRSNDAMLILRKAAGLAAPKIQPVAIGKTIAVMLGEAHSVAGESVTVPLKVDNFHELAGGDICIGYESAVLRAVDVSSDSDLLLQSNIAESGMVRIAFASADRVNSKTVAEIRFDILADDVSPLTFLRVELYQSDAILVDSKKIDGQFISWAIPPENSALLQNFPNPFNAETWIPYELAKDATVTIRIYNTKGQLLRILHLGKKKAGIYITKERTAYWDGKDAVGQAVSSGVYFYQIEAGDFNATRKMVIVK